ncbi:MAG: hypothetical protein IKO94_01205 [Selenomonadaceae bacterium]|nr:hypothetical protein [Clostridia bacterium]MBR4694681.1 hypothetical protein [Selenomonadaceae bacterium]
MIAKEVFAAYFDVFDSCIKHDEGGSDTIFVEDDDGNAFSLDGLTDQQIMDKIERSKKAGINLFFIECPPWNPQYEDDAQY